MLFEKLHDLKLNFPIQQKKFKIFSSASVDYIKHYDFLKLITYTDTKNKQYIFKNIKAILKNTTKL